MGLLLARDRVKLLRKQTLAEPLGVIPAGVIGEVVTVGPTGALVRFRGKYPPTPVNLSDLEHAGLVDLLPTTAQGLLAVLQKRAAAGVAIAAAAAIVGLVGWALRRFLGG